MKSVQIRPAVGDDIADIVMMSTHLAMTQEKGPLDPGALIFGIYAVFAEPRHNSQYFVAVSDGKLVGQLLLTREWNDHRNSYNAWIRRLYVRPEARLRGIAWALVEHVTEAVHDVEEFKFNVYRDNKASIRLFERLGGKFDAENGSLQS